jgi:cytochrome c oxidase assembly protein subunit 15
VPAGEAATAAANAAYPDRPLEHPKAWKEMVHRYLAGALGLAVVGLAITAWRRRAPVRGPVLGLVGLVLFQALLGMWTVTLLVKPVVVTAHLLGGILTFAGLWWLALRQGPPPALLSGARGLHKWALLALGLVLVQIALGGWTSSNYAALGCTEFPRCHSGAWWPATDFREAFVLWRGTGVSYEYGVLDAAARTAIHLAHRLGALAVLLVAGGLALRLAATGIPALRRAGMALAGALALQMALGIANVLGGLPLPVAVAHTGTAALLACALLSAVHLLRPLPANRPLRAPQRLLGATR